MDLGRFFQAMASFFVAFFFFFFSFFLVLFELGVALSHF